MKRGKKTALCLLLTLTLFLISACCAPGSGAEPRRYQAEFLTLFDTYTKIVGYSDSKEKFEEQVRFIHDGLERYHQYFDIYNDYEGVNNIKTINDNAGAAPVKVSPEIIGLLEFALEVYDMTDGKVNVAFGSVLSVWHDSREDGIDDPEHAALPSADVLREAAAHTDIKKMIIDQSASTVYLGDSRMSLDVGALAKGYAVEMVCRDAEKKDHVTSMLISVGGNIRAIGFRDGDSEKWTVGIQNPNAGPGSALQDENQGEATDDVLATVKIADTSVVTSGDYQRYFTVDGKRYNHIIEPDTLMPADYYRSVTILCPDSGMADALSTAAFLMDFETGKALIDSTPDAQAVYVMRDGSLRTVGSIVLDIAAKVVPEYTNPRHSRMRPGVLSFYPAVLPARAPSFAFLFTLFSGSVTTAAVPPPSAAS